MYIYIYIYVGRERREQDREGDGLARGLGGDPEAPDGPTNLLRERNPLLIYSERGTLY